MAGVSTCGLSAAVSAASGVTGGGIVGCVLGAGVFTAAAPSDDDVWAGAVDDVASVVPLCRRPSWAPPRHTPRAGT